MRHILIILLTGLSLTTFGQSLNQKRTQPAPTQPAAQPASQKPAMSAATQHYLTKYATAARWNDMDVARDALYDLIIENPTSDSLIFTLGYFYFENQKYASSLLIAQDLLLRNAKNETYLQLAAVSAQELGVNDKALQHFESLYLISNDVSTLYQITFLQFTMKRFKEAMANAETLLGKPESATTNVMFNDPQGKPKEYPMKVAVINLKGVISLENGDKPAAKKFFNEALALAPDFVPARENLEKAK